MIRCLLLLLLFIRCFGAPAKEKSFQQRSTLSPITTSESTEISFQTVHQLYGGNIENEPPVDTTDLFKVQIEEGDDENCYFRKERKSIFEKQPRSRESDVSTQCEGGTKRMEELINEMTFNEYTEAFNSADLVMARGASTYVNWQDPGELSKVKNLLICKKHEQELLRKWKSKEFYKHMKEKVKCGSRKVLCSMPESPNTIYGKISHPDGRIAEEGRGVTRNHAEIFLRQEGVHLHIGLPLCRAHREYLDELVNAQKKGYETPSEIEKSDYSMDECDEITNIQSLTISESRHDSEYKCPRERQGEPLSPYRGTLPEVFYQAAVYFLKITKLIIEEPKKYFEDVCKRTKSRLLLKWRSASEMIADVLTKGRPNIILEHCVFKSQIEDKSDASKSFNKILNGVRKAYLNAPTRQERRLIIGAVAQSITYRQILNVIPDLTEYEFTESRKELVRLQNGEEEEKRIIVRHRLHPESVNRFIEFITQPPIAIPLPYAKTIKGPDGLPEIIPAMIRTMRDSYIINLFRKQHAEDGIELKISNTTMRTILKTCSASRQKSMDCVDSFIADGLMGFSDIEEIIDELQEKHQITNEEAFEIKSLAENYRFYLQHDYYVHIDTKSDIAEFCMNYALSDPHNPKFKADKCYHKFHCPRCQLWSNAIERLNDILFDLKESIKSGEEKMITATQLEFIDIKLEKATEYIKDWQRHIVRSVYTDRQLAKIIQNLGENEGVAIMDYAQKYLPTEFIEKQANAFGKAGMSWHITYVLVKKNGKLMQHTFVHLMGFVKQDFNQVSAILRDVLILLKEKGIKNITLRSDNAGYYHSGKMFTVIPNLSKETGVFVKRYSFSEAQNGKSAADRETGRCKRMLRDYIDAGNDITSAEEMFEAFQNYSRLAGLTVRQGTVENPVNNPDPTIEKIRQIGEVEYDKSNKMKMWRFYGIGPGVVLKISDYSKMKSGVFTAVNTWDSSMKEIPLWRELGSKAEYPEKSPQSNEKEYDDQAAFSCPVDTCPSQFSTRHELDEHVRLGQHTHVIQTMTSREYMIYQYRKANDERSMKQRKIIEKTLDSILEYLDDGEEIEPLGWALPDKYSDYKTNADVNKFLKEQVKAFVDNGQRPDHRKIYDSMNKATQGGKVRFPKEDRLKLSQINSRVRRFYNEYIKDKKDKTNNSENSKKHEETKNIEKIMDFVLKDLQENEGDPAVEDLDSEFIIDSFDEIRNCYGNGENDESIELETSTATPVTTTTPSALTTVRRSERRRLNQGDAPQSKKKSKGNL